MINLKRLARKGSQVAFANKTNADKYRAMLRKEGYTSGFIRSSGPTVDRNPKGIKAYYIIPEKKSSRKSITRTTQPKQYSIRDLI